MNVIGERILIFGDSLSHPGPDKGPSIVDITVPLGIVSSAPGELIARQLLSMGAQAARVDAKVGRSARSFFSTEDSAGLLNSDRAFAPTKVVVFLGTNDINLGTDADALTKTRDAMTRIRDAYRVMGAEVFAIGPPSFSNQTLNNGASAMFALVQSVFGADHTVDARPLVIGAARAGDGVHFTAAGAAAVAPQLVRALTASVSAAAGPSTGMSTGAKAALGFVVVAGFAGLGWLALHVAKRAAERPGLGATDVKLIKRVAQLISYDVSKQAIREQLVAEGYDDDDVFQAYQAAKVYLRRREIPDSNYGRATAFRIGMAAARYFARRR